MKPSRRLSLFLLTVCLTFAWIAVASAQSFTLEQVMSSPFPSELTASKRGDKIA